MTDADRLFNYRAFDASGRRVKGTLSARGDAEVFERLKREGLSPIQIVAARGTAGAPALKRGGLTDRDLAGFLADLGALLKAGADMRAALGILGARSSSGALRTLSRALNTEISGGGALEQAFSRHLGKNQAFIGALIAAGEAAGDISAGFQRAAEMLESRIKLRDQLVSTLSYPGFVFASTIVAIAVILLFVIPSLAPLVEDAGAKPPASLKMMIGASTFLRSHLTLLIAGFGAIVGGLLIAGRMGALTTPIERFLLDGPAGRTVRRLTYGGFAIALGNMLAAGAPMSDALRLAMRAVGSSLARDRLAPVAQAVRQGQALPAALEKITDFPVAIVRLAAVGEVSGALGVMIARAGRLEEETAIRRIESIGRILGPALIVLLGGLIGLLMAGLLSGVSQLGDSALP